MTKIISIAVDVNSNIKPYLIGMAWENAQDGGDTKSFRVNTSRSIDIDMSVTHGITKQSLTNMSKIGEHIELINKELSGNILITPEYETLLEVLKNEKIGLKSYVIDIVQVFKKIFANAENQPKSYNIQYLRYWLKLDAVGSITHMSVDEAYITSNLFTKAMDILEKVEQLKGNKQAKVKWMIKASKEPIILVKMPVGQYKGVLFTDIQDMGYLHWIVSNSDFDKNIKHTANLVLKGGY